MEKQTEQQSSSAHPEHHQEHHPAAHSIHHPEHHPVHHSTPHSPAGTGSIFTGWNWVLLGIVVVIMVVNQVLITNVSGQLTGSSVLGGVFSSGSSGGKDLSTIDIDSLKSTGHTVAAVFPVESFKSAEDAMAAMFPTGTPEYGPALGVNFDDPVTSLATLSNMYRGLKAEVEKNKPDAFKRFMTLAGKPVGISCEYCCGIGTIGIDKKGNSACGCQHNPALLSVALYLTAYTDYSDAEILREVMRWKTLFFPKNMIELGTSLAGGDTSKLELPGMVGGC
ncbi:MAG: hypothetical protein AABY26_02950 [Nanoarchaeota archaeon]